MQNICDLKNILKFDLSVFVSRKGVFVVFIVPVKRTTDQLNLVPKYVTLLVRGSIICTAERRNLHRKHIYNNF